VVKNLTETYHGVRIADEEIAVLHDLSKLLKKPLKIVEDVVSNGIVIENNHIIGLNLFRYSLKKLPESIGNLKFLRFLLLRNNQITDFPKALFKLKNIEELDLCWNRLTAIPESFGQLRSLKKVCLSYNKIRTLPESIGQLKALIELDLNSNELIALPDSIGDLRNLKILKLNDNKLDSVPKSLYNLISLREIRLDDNFLTRSSQEFMKKFEKRGCKVIIPEKVILQEKFKFFSDNIFLSAWFDTETGKQKLVMEKVNPITKEVELEDEIDCIHTVVMEIPYEGFREVIEDEEFEPKILNLISTEQLWEIDLDNSEKFKALKSWVAGIAESGVDAFKIQTQIDTAAKQMYPLAQRLLRFMAMAEPYFIPEFLYKVSKDCMYEGISHKSCIIANFTPILDMLVLQPQNGIPGPDWEYIKEDNLYYLKHFRQILSVMFDLDLPLKLFTQNYKFFGFLRLPDAVKISNFRDAFKHPDPKIRKNIALNSEAVEFEEFEDFFSSKTEPNFEVSQAITRNPNGLNVYRKVLESSIIPQKEKDALWELATLLKKPIPKVDNFVWDDNYIITKRREYQNLGVMIEKGHVIGLGIVFQQDLMTFLPESIGELNYLKYLGLYKNNLVLLPESLEKLKSLTILTLGGNNLKIIPDSIGKLTNLKKLSLHSNQLEILPVNFNNLTRIEDLDLKENYLIELPECLKSMKSLKYLNLKGNLLTSLPDFLGNYSKMRELYIGSNIITEIPESIGNMEFLRILSAGSNKLKAIPKSLGRLKNLEKLILNTNELTFLPDSLVKLMNLKYLNLAFNRLGKFPTIMHILKEYGCKVILSNEDYDPFELSNDGILRALGDNIPYSTNDLAKKMKIMTDIDLRTLKFKLKGLADNGLVLIYKKDNRIIWKIK
jgi:Leucine-rich repeat (LRR) protein